MEIALLIAMSILLAGAVAYVIPHFLEPRAELQRTAFGQLEQIRSSAAALEEAELKLSEAARTKKDLATDRVNERYKQRGLIEQITRVLADIRPKRKKTIGLLEKMVDQGVLETEYRAVRTSRLTPDKRTALAEALADPKTEKSVALFEELADKGVVAKSYRVADDSMYTPEDQVLLAETLADWGVLAKSNIEAAAERQVAEANAALDEEKLAGGVPVNESEKKKGSRAGSAQQAAAPPVMAAAALPIAGPGQQPRANTASGPRVSPGQGGPIAAAPARPQTRAQARGPRYTS